MLPHDDAMVEVELVDDEPGGHSPASPAPAVDRRPPWARYRLSHLGTAGIVVVLLLAVVGGFLLARPGPLTPGTVRSLDDPVGPRWQTEGVVLGVARDLVVVQSDIFQVREVTVIDAATGQERWNRRLGASGVATTCLPAVTAAPAAVWCTRNLRVVTDPGTGEAGTQEAAIVGLSLDDGAVLAERVMRIPSAGVGVVADDLVVADRVGATLTVRRLDARTWDPIWSSAVELSPRTTDGQIDAMVEAGGDLVVVRGSTVAVLRASDGAELARWEPVVEPLVRTLEAAEVEVAPSGFATWSEMSAGVRTDAGVWHNLTGAELAGFAGAWAEPPVSDGSGTGVLLVSADPGEVTAVDVAGGRGLWSAPAAGGALLRHDDAVVLADGDLLTSIEVGSGRHRWSAAVAGLRPGAGAVTDGRSMAVLAFHGARWRLVAIDLRTGRVMWVTLAPGIPAVTDEVNIAGQARVSAVGGHLVVRWGRTLTWAG